jgi:hydroxymethylglutaryl-CoA lyase
VGVATVADIDIALKTLVPKYPAINFGVHLHSTVANWQEKLDAAVNAGCKRFDGALKGIGGCPMAQDDLVGNMDSALMIPYFEEKGLLNDIDHAALQNALTIADKIFV